MIYWFKNHGWKVVQYLLLAALTIEFIRDSLGTGDFVGYVNAGHNVVKGLNIYGDYLNTWPPLFSIFSVPLAIADALSPVFIRALWLLFMLVAMFHIMAMTIKQVLQLQLGLPFNQQAELRFDSAIVIVPVLLIFRYLLDNMANIQINIFMLWMAMYSFELYSKGKFNQAAFWLALSISLKVYTIFILAFYAYRMSFRMFTFTCLWITGLNLICIPVFGIEQSIQYFHQFLSERAGPFAMALHKNQSLFALLRGLLHHESRGLGIYINLVDLSIETIRWISYALVAICGLSIAYLFKLKKTPEISQFYFVLGATPILSPLAWKAYFIFVWPSLFLVTYHLWFANNRQRPMNLLNRMLMLFFILTFIISTEGIIGEKWSDIAEIFGCITLGNLVLLVLHYRTKDMIFNSL